jgi:hypothetical protein
VLVLGCVATLVVAFGSSAPADELTVESFTGIAVSDPSAWVAGGNGLIFPDWPGSACLSAGTDTGQEPIPGCQDPSADPPGAGVLRVTTTSGNQGFALYQKALPTAGGIDITFHQAQWGRTALDAGDGQAFFLIDGAFTVTQPGGGGGGLGYAPGDAGGSGIAHGLLGVGIDSFGNYGRVVATNPSGGCLPGTGPGSRGEPTLQPDRVTVRGPGDGTQGYCWLGASEQLPEISGATRAEATNVVRIVVDPDTVPGTRMVTVYLDGIQVVQVPAPPELLAVPTFKFGLSGSIGAANDFHEFWNLDIQSVNPINPPTPVVEPIVLEPSFTG